MTSVPVVKVSFKEKMLRAREEAIVRTVNLLLAEKGFDAMTVDEVAARVGIAKASLYKHFASKEDLAAAAMLVALQSAQTYIATLPAAAPPLENLRAVVRWTVALKLRGEMPSLPSQNSRLHGALMAKRGCAEGLLQVSTVLRGWIGAAQAQGALHPHLPVDVVLCTLYARACDPVLEFLKIGGRYDDAQLVDFVLATCFDGLNAR